MNCEFCHQESTYEIRGIRLCPEHATEALEHGADFTNDFRDVRFTSEELKHPLLAEAQLARNLIVTRRKYLAIREIKLCTEMTQEQLEFISHRLKGAA